MPKQKIVFSGDSFGNIVAGQTYYVKTIFNSSQFTISVTPGGPDLTLTTEIGFMTGIASQYSEYYVSGVGSAIKLLPVSDYVVPETYATDFDNNTALVDPAEADYLTISRDSPDLNAWSRSNRWFHRDVIVATSVYNNTPVAFETLFTAKRPIIQFRGGIRLFNMGTSGKAPIDTIDFSQTDAFSNVEGQTSYSVNGYTFVNGTRVIFAADTDPDVRDKIWVVNFVSPDTIDPIMAQPIINLVLAQDGNVLVDENTVVNDSTQIGKTFWYNGINWTEAQEKTAVQQAPLW